MPHADHSARLQGSQRLPDGCAAHAEEFAQLALTGQPVAGLQAVARYMALDLISDPQEPQPAY